MKDKAINKLNNEFAKLETIENLKRSGLSLSDYHVIYDLLGDLAKHGEAKTIINYPAMWLRKHGASVSWNGIEWIITI